MATERQNVGFFTIFTTRLYITNASQPSGPSVSPLVLSGHTYLCAGPQQFPAQQDWHSRDILQVT